MKLWKKSEIQNFREKLILGLWTIPIPNSTEQERKLARIGAIYALGKILGLPDGEVEK